MGEANYDSRFFEVLSAAEPGSFWFRARNRLVVSVLGRFFPRMGSLLEVGCGTGFVLAHIRQAYPHARLVGIDLFEEGLRVARKRVPDAELYKQDIRNLPFEHSFEVVCALDVLEHLDDDQSALLHMRRAVKEGGGVLLLVPQHRWLWSGADTFAHHRRRYRRREFITQIRAAGFEIQLVSSFVTSLLPAMFVSRFVQRALSRPYDLSRELKPGLFNRPFEFLLDAEARLIVQHGVSMPAGGSLLIVARAI